MNTYTWNLERWHQQTSLQGSNGDADIENLLVDTVGEGERRLTERVSSKHVHYYM